jgi:hypothetical protein
MDETCSTQEGEGEGNAEMYIKYWPENLRAHGKLWGRCIDKG